MAKKIKQIKKPMKNKLKRFYTMEDIMKLEATYNLIFSGRNAGKSYESKKRLLEEAYKKNRLLGLVFRTDQEAKTNTDILKYFSDMGHVIEKLTGGKYDKIYLKARELYFYKEEEDEEVEVQDKHGNWKLKTIKGKKSKGPLIGYVFFLDKADFYKSKIFPNVENLLFEEVFIKVERGKYYLEDEPAKLDSLVSTIFRNTKTGKIYMIGNLHSTVNPYVFEWGIRDMFKQAEGTIELYELESSEGKKILLAIERVKNNNKQGYALSKKGKQQEQGEWESGDYLTASMVDIEKFTTRYEFIFTYMGFYFLCEFKVKGSDMFLYITRKTTDIKPNTRVIGDIPNISLLYTSDFKPLVDRERVVFDLLFQNKLVFGDNLTGEDFNVALNTMRKNL